MSTTVFLRCPCCGSTHRLREDDSIRRLLKRQAANLTKSEQRSFVWTQESAQGPDGRWTAAKGDQVELNDPDARVFYDTLAERAREFLSWYEAET